MMNFMNFSGTGWLWGWHIHMLFGLAALAGLVLFLVWASRLKAETLKLWVIWLLAIGIVGHLLTSSWGWIGMKNMMGGWGGHPMMWQYMQGEDGKYSDEWRNSMLEEMEERMGLQ